ncbi:MAG: hypothetical protein VX055_02175, partial [Pseudomonadota bacterium]|nr:hypothetical protein [Pseudomonadota bacterium]
MRISQRMQAKQSQKLHLSPQLQQSILVLQMNNLELAELLQAEVEKNPFLETDEGDEHVVSREEPGVSVSASSDVALSTDMGAEIYADRSGSNAAADTGEL